MQVGFNKKHTCVSLPSAEGKGSGNETSTNFIQLQMSVFPKVSKVSTQYLSQYTINFPSLPVEVEFKAAWNHDWLSEMCVFAWRIWHVWLPLYTSPNFCSPSKQAPERDGCQLSFVLRALLCNLSKQWVSRFVYKGTECNSEWELGAYSFALHSRWQVILLGPNISG